MSEYDLQVTDSAGNVTAVTITDIPADPSGERAFATMVRKAIEDRFDDTDIDVTALGEE